MHDSGSGKVCRPASKQERPRVFPALLVLLGCERVLTPVGACPPSRAPSPVHYLMYRGTWNYCADYFSEQDFVAKTEVQVYCTYEDTRTYTTTEY